VAPVLTAAAVSHAVLNGFVKSTSEKEPFLPTKRRFRDCCRRMGHFCGVERVKRFVNVHLHCIVSNLKRISKMSTPPLEKFLRTPVCRNAFAETND